jgi:hypothetical protein
MKALTPIVDRLRNEGHVVDYVAEMDPGISDDVVLEWKVFFSTRPVLFKEGALKKFSLT